MARHYNPGDESPFLKRVLIPFWVVRIIIMAVDIAAYALIIGVVAAYRGDDSFEDIDEEYASDTAVNIIIAIACVILVLILICLIVDFVCIVKRYRHTLQPRFFLIVNVVQTTFWTILFALGFVGGVRSGFVTFLSIIPYLSFVGLLIYASVIFHRSRKGTLSTGKVIPSTHADGHLLGQNTGYAVPVGQEYAQRHPEPSYGEGVHQMSNYDPHHINSHKNAQQPTTSAV